MKDAFVEMDKDSTGLLTIDEFENKLGDEHVIAYFNYLKLDVSDAHTLFKFLDRDNSKEVSIEEFINGCYKLQGESRNLDVKIMQCEVKAIWDSLIVFGDIIREVRDAVRRRSRALIWSFILLTCASALRL